MRPKDSESEQGCKFSIHHGIDCQGYKVGQPGSTVFAKANGNVTEMEVESGVVPRIDKVDNDGTDEMARAGANPYAVSFQLLQEAALRKHAAVNVQRMMLEIITARWTQQHAPMMSRNHHTS